MQEIVSVFGNGFFPVVMCGVLFWYVVQRDEKHKEEIETLRQTMQENNKNFIAALKSVETAINSLREALNK